MEHSQNTDSNTQNNVNSGPVTDSDYQRKSEAPLKLSHVCNNLQYTCCTQTDNHFTTTTY